MATTNLKRTLYRTAQAKIGCASFREKEFVAVTFDHVSNSGVAWYRVTRTERGELDSPVMYPEHHLTRFSL
jgi:hypothetical protein